MRSWQGLLLTAVCLISFSACKGIGGNVDPGICAKDTQCEKGQVYRKGVCAVSRCDARKGDADCCPGQRCGFDGSCTNNLADQVCTDDTGCSNGQRCLSRPELMADQKVCSFQLPSETGVCPSTYRLFNHRCIDELPCGGGCPDTQICDIELNLCEAVPNVPTADSGCDVTCGTGTIKTLTDPDGMFFGQCCSLQCACEPLPPLAEGIYGRFADAVVTKDEILVSSYNDLYGDLVVSHHDKATGKATQLEFVDGMPNGGTVGGDARGPRGGFSDKGPNVGLFTSIAIGEDGRPRIAYYDQDNKDLKYAEKQPDGTWKTHVVDSAGDVGQYAQLRFLAGRLRLVYFVRAAPRLATPGDGLLYTTLRYAEAKQASPASADDWVKRDATQPEVVRNPCGGECTATEVCLFTDGQTRACGSVQTPDVAPMGASGSSGASGVTGLACQGDPAGKICAQPRGGSKGFYYQDPISTVTELPAGKGLFPSIDFSNGRILVAYYDNYTSPNLPPPVVIANGTLRAVSAPLSGTSASIFDAPVVLDKGTVCNSTKARDVGRFASLRVAQNGEAGVAYVDVTRGALRYYTGNGQVFVEDMGCMPADGTQSSNPRVVVADTGVDIANSRVSLVGADASVYYDATNKAYVAYQDQSNLAVKLATETSPGVWFTKTVSDEAGDGFEIQLLPDGNTLYLLSVRIGFDQLGNPENKVLVRPIKP